MSDTEEALGAGPRQAGNEGDGGGNDNGDNGNDAAVATIVAVTGADAETAAHLLDASGGDVDAAVSLFLEGGGGGTGRASFEDAVAVGAAGGGGGGGGGGARDGTDAIVLSDDDNDDNDDNDENRGSGGAAAAATRATETRTGSRPRRRRVIDDDDNDYLDEEGYVDVSDDDHDENDDEEGRQQRRTRAAAAAAMAATTRGGGATTRTAAGATTTAATTTASRPPLPFDLPDGINAEEARMLEAAMLGVPYDGPIPDFTNVASNTNTAAALSPGAVAARALRREQDDAFERSLAEDRRKAEEASAREREARERERREREEREREARAEVERAAAADKASEEAKARLSSRSCKEPNDEDDDSSIVQVAVRCPGGERLSRKFSKKDDVSLLFDFVDSERPSGVAFDHETSSFRYRLLTSFPRKAIEKRAGLTFEGAGLCSKAEAVMLELPAE